MAIEQRILVTGSSGFIGSALLRYFGSKNIVAMGRLMPEGFTGSFQNIDIDTEADFTKILEGVAVVIHCAGRAHIAGEGMNEIDIYRKVNCDGTLKLAKQAQKMGVKRFIYLSSIGVNGEVTTGNLKFQPDDVPRPVGVCAHSKAEAEIGLLKLAKETGMEVVIIRPALVYGPKVKANFLNLMKLANTVLPLPFGNSYNQRSMVYLGNLVSFIDKCIDHPIAQNQTFTLSDGRDLSLREIITLLRSAIGRPSRLFPVPISLFKLAGLIFRREDFVRRLIGSLQVDSGKAYKLLGWQPPFTVEQGFQATVDDFLDGGK